MKRKLDFPVILKICMAEAAASLLLNLLLYHRLNGMYFRILGAAGLLVLILGTLMERYGAVQNYISDLSSTEPVFHKENTLLYTGWHLLLAGAFCAVLGGLLHILFGS